MNKFNDSMTPSLLRSLVDKRGLAAAPLVLVLLMAFLNTTPRQISVPPDAGDLTRVSHFDRKIPVPPCARDVFVALNRTARDGSENTCKGLLIRDDIIITSKACSRFKFTFDFAGLDTIVKATPHTSLNSKEEMSHSRLGFLEVHPPFHYTFIDRPVRRARMFLRKRKPSGVIITCGDRQEPIAHNFPVGGEMVPLGSLYGSLPDDILWDDSDTNTASMLEHMSRRWWTRPITLKEEESTLKKYLSDWRGPPGSVSIPDAHYRFLPQACALMEAIDPRGHRQQYCFENYYKRYRDEQPFSGLHFFDWLDFGDGKLLFEMNDVNNTFHYRKGDEDCYKKDFNRLKVHYFDDNERRAHEVVFEPSESGDVIARYKQSNRLVPRSSIHHPHLYFWDLNKRFYIVDHTWNKKNFGPIKHTGLAGGKPGLSGGVIYFRDRGVMWGISVSSGHYRPRIQALAILHQWMKYDRAFNVTSMHWVGKKEPDDGKKSKNKSWSIKNCLDTHWEEIEIPGFNATALNQSCRELTQSPTWILREYS